MDRLLLGATNQLLMHHWFFFTCSGQGSVHGRQLRSESRGAWVHDPGGGGSEGHDRSGKLPHQILLHRRRQDRPSVMGVEPANQKRLGQCRVKRSSSVSLSLRCIATDPIYHRCLKQRHRLGRYGFAGFANN